MKIASISPVAYSRQNTKDSVNKTNANPSFKACEFPNGFFKDSDCAKDLGVWMYAALEEAGNITVKRLGDKRYGLTPAELKEITAGSKTLEEIASQAKTPTSDKIGGILKRALHYVTHNDVIKVSEEELTEIGFK